MPHSSEQPLDIHQLRVLVALSKSGSFTQAGHDLHVTQSAISHSIRALEEATGCRLFDRVGKTAHLTPAGEQLLHHARAILRESFNARVALRRRANWGRARLRVVIHPSLAEWGLAKAARAFQREHPECPVSVEQAIESRAVELLVAGAADVAFGIAPRNETRVEVEPLGMDELGWVVPDGHPWAVQRRVETSELAGQVMILPPIGDGTRTLVDRFLEREKHSFVAHVETVGVGLTLSMVREGVGIGLLGDWVLVRPEVQTGLALVSSGKKALRRAWSTMRLRGTVMSWPAESFARRLAEGLVR